MARNRYIAFAIALALTLALVATVSLSAIATTSTGEGRPEASAHVAASAPAAPDDPAAATTSTTQSPAADTTVPTDGLPTPSDDSAATGGKKDADASHGSGGATTVPSAPVHEVLPGTGGAPPTTPLDPIGDLDDDRPVPAGFDFTAPPKKPGAPNGLGGPDGLAVAPSCSHQCITKGVAYPRGFGAELVVETSVPAQLFISAIADLDGDGTYEDTHFESVNFLVESHSWTIDHLEPGQTYYAMVAATDANGHTAHAWGEFTTLSQRSVFVELGNGEIVGGPGNISSTHWLLGLDGPLTDVTPGQQGILLYHDVPRLLDLDFWVTRSWDDELCEVWQPAGAPSHGHESGACVAWNSTSQADVDLDVAPAGKTRWTSTSVSLSLQPPSGEGDALPPGYGDPYYFWFSVPVTLHVTYS